MFPLQKLRDFLVKSRRDKLSTESIIQQIRENNLFEDISLYDLYDLGIKHKFLRRLIVDEAEKRSAVNFEREFLLEFLVDDLNQEKYYHLLTLHEIIKLFPGTKPSDSLISSIIRSAIITIDDINNGVNWEDGSSIDFYVTEEIKTPTNCLIETRKSLNMNPHIPIRWFSETDPQFQWDWNLIIESPLMTDEYVMMHYEKINNFKSFIKYNATKSLFDRHENIRYHGKIDKCGCWINPNFEFEFISDILDETLRDDYYRRTEAIDFDFCHGYDTDTDTDEEYKLKHNWSKVFNQCCRNPSINPEKLVDVFQSLFEGSSFKDNYSFNKSAIIANPMTSRNELNSSSSFNNRNSRYDLLSLNSRLMFDEVVNIVKLYSKSTGQKHLSDFNLHLSENLRMKDIKKYIDPSLTTKTSISLVISKQVIVIKFDDVLNSKPTDKNSNICWKQTRYIQYNKSPNQRYITKKILDEFS